MEGHQQILIDVGPGNTRYTTNIQVTGNTPKYRSKSLQILDRGMLHTTLQNDMSPTNTTKKIGHRCEHLAVMGM